jgi:hypothetical protein
MLHVTDYEVVELSACSTEILAWRLAWAREYRGRIEHELMSRLEDGKDMEFNGIKVTQPRPRISYTLTGTDRKWVESLVTKENAQEVETFFETLRAQQMMGRPWLSISVMEGNDDDNS